MVQSVPKPYTRSRAYGMFTAKWAQVDSSRVGIPASAWAQAKRGYRLLHHPRATTWQWTKSLYRLAQRTAREAKAEVRGVAMDPVQLEKPCAAGGRGKQGT